MNNIVDWITFFLCISLVAIGGVIAVVKEDAVVIPIILIVTGCLLGFLHPEFVLRLFRKKRKRLKEGEK